MRLLRNNINLLLRERPETARLRAIERRDCVSKTAVVAEFTANTKYGSQKESKK
jgi:hypothetical protein